MTDGNGTKVTATVTVTIYGANDAAVLTKAAEASVVKLAPGVTPTDLAPGETEFISENRGLTQALLWTGRFAEASADKVRATMLPERLSILATPEALDLTDSDRDWLYTIDPALERARLTSHVARRFGLLGLAHPGTGLLTGPEPIDDPWIRGYRRLARMPGNERRVRAWLRDYDAGTITVKTSAGVVQPDALQKSLRGKGDRPAVVFVLRLGSSVEAIITEPPKSRDRSTGSSIHPDRR